MSDLKFSKQKPDRDTILRRIATATRDWGGTLLDQEGCLHLVHPDADQPAVYWCFNSAHEFAKLANALGAGQPLVGLRSLNKILDAGLTMSFGAEILAKYYADHLLAAFGKKACVIGGNCQAASIAYRVALRLLDKGVPVVRLVTLDAQLRYPYPGHLRALFGKDSSYNPANRSTDDSSRNVMEKWDYSAAKFDCRIVDGGHGSFFAPENIASLAREIMAPAERPMIQASAFVKRVDLCRMDWRISKVEPGFVTIDAPAVGRAEDVAMLPVWRQDDGTFFRIDSEAWLQPWGHGTDWHCQIPTPVSPGRWNLWPVMCQRKLGPVAWPLEYHKRLKFR